MRKSCDVTFIIKTLRKLIEGGRVDLLNFDWNQRIMPAGFMGLHNVLVTNVTSHDFLIVVTGDPNQVMTDMRQFRQLSPLLPTLPSVLADDVEGAEGRDLLLGELAVVGLLRQRHQTDLVGVAQLHGLALILCRNKCAEGCFSVRLDLKIKAGFAF